MVPCTLFVHANSTGGVLKIFYVVPSLTLMVATWVNKLMITRFLANPKKNFSHLHIVELISAMCVRLCVRWDQSHPFVLK